MAIHSNGSLMFWIIIIAIPFNVVAAIANTLLLNYLKRGSVMAPISLLAIAGLSSVITVILNNIIAIYYILQWSQT